MRKYFTGFLMVSVFLGQLVQGLRVWGKIDNREGSLKSKNKNVLRLVPDEKNGITSQGADSVTKYPLLKSVIAVEFNAIVLTLFVSGQ